MYGITETTVHVTYRPLTAADARWPGAARSARPIPDLCAATSSTATAGRCPSGCRASCWSAAPAWPAATWAGPALTAERFVPDPFAGRPGARLYRTGDLARRLRGRRPRVPGAHRPPGQGARLPHRARARSRPRWPSHPAVRRAVVLLRGGGPADRAAGRLTSVPHRAAGPPPRSCACTCRAAARLHGAGALRPRSTAAADRSTARSTAAPCRRRTRGRRGGDARRAAAATDGEMRLLRHLGARCWALGGSASTTTSSISAATRCWRCG